MQIWKSVKTSQKLPESKTNYLQLNNDNSAGSDEPSKALSIKEARKVIQKILSEDSTLIKLLKTAREIKSECHIRCQGWHFAYEDGTMSAWQTFVPRDRRNVIPFSIGKKDKIRFP